MWCHRQLWSSVPIITVATIIPTATIVPIDPMAAGIGTPTGREVGLLFRHGGYSCLRSPCRLWSDRPALPASTPPTPCRDPPRADKATLQGWRDVTSMAAAAEMSLPVAHAPVFPTLTFSCYKLTGPLGDK